MRIVHISDVHIGDADQGILDAAARAVNALQPDAIALSGDITQSGRAREFSAAGAYLRQFEAPIVATPGNHDAPVYHPLLRVMRPYHRFAALPVQGTWTAPSNALCLRQVRTARAIQARRDWSQGAYDLATLEAALAQSPACAWTALIAHHPPGTHKGAHVRSDARRGARARAALAKRDRVLLLAGHAHGFAVQRLNERGAAIIIAPSLASGRPRTGAHGFVQIDVSPRAALVTLHATSGDAFVPTMEMTINGGHAAAEADA